ncbi:Gfo/Idh/MocA family protein [Mesobacillus foraminis]|uniref:Putative dehydrogenase n=1 Tax=Mesobacillus foraminis TaxID=279826 RepID=A0A4R2BK02_9BACI|nr:Gfo/Idh/MocA family oxidoreductase [Mesobacillus foraminis]TCN27481.1 putative dehydrogenase [Mesobacillus foraminis]
MSVIKVGVMGIGNMGRSHVQLLGKGKINGAILTAVCDPFQDNLKELLKDTAGDVQIFKDEDAFLNESDIDAVLISTPHYDHPRLAVKAFAKGMHVLVEKPAGVYTKSVAEMNKAAKESGKVFGIMYNQRCNPIYQKLRELIQSGELGEIKRTNWIITDWYRSQSYYDSSEWRATWKGEGGGVLLNQAPHQLDLWQWTTGLMPKKVHAFCSYGKYHDIEVEDEITAYVEYENGATGIFITSTGEAPGTNRFEISGDRGKMVVENDKLIFHRLTQSEREFNATYKGGFGKPECWTIDIPIKGERTDHQGIMQNWIDSIAKGTPLLAPGEEGIKGLEISNAIYLSSWLKEPVELPIDAELFYKKLQEKINQSSFQKKNVEKVIFDVSETH